MVRRSVLFSPGAEPDKLRGATETAADVVVFDLEDGVAPGAKGRARDAVAAVLSEIDPDAEVWVRVNPVDNGGADDLAVILDGSPRLDGIVQPKVESAEAVDTLVTVLEESDRNLPVIALIETAAGVLQAEAIAAVPETDALIFGAEDLAADVGATRTATGDELAYARQHVVLAASAAGIDAIDTLLTDFEDTDQLRADTRRAIDLGYDGKLAIHPDQVAVINEAFTPSPERVAWAERIIAARENAETEGGVFAVDGEMIDAPLVAQAEQVIARADAAGIR